MTFVKAYNDDFHRNPDFFSIGGYDGMHLIYEALKKTGGKTDGESLIAAAKGMSWESPRGPMSIDPETRDVVQTVYIRRVEKVGDGLRNVEFDKVENVKDPGKEQHEEMMRLRLALLPPPTHATEGDTGRTAMLRPGSSMLSLPAVGVPRPGGNQSLSQTLGGHHATRI